MQALEELAKPVVDGGDADSAEAALPMSVVQAFLESTLTQVPVSGGFLQGRVTFCSLKPMRAIPARLLGVLGLDDGEFPRRNSQLAFDLMAARPRRGDRSVRDDDRYMFFETLLGARQMLYLSYVGQSQRDADITAPSSVVVELLDYLGATTAIHHHALQAFSPRYFSPGPLQSFSPDNARAAEVVRRGKSVPRPFFTSALAEPDPALLCITPEDLASFLAHPARVLCQRRLGLRLTRDADVLPAHEPRALDSLQRYQLQQALLEETLHGDAALAWPAAKARGKVPPGPLGVQIETTLRDRVDRLARDVQPLRVGSARERIDIDVSAEGCIVRGSINDVYGDRLLRYRCASLQPKDLLQAWALHVLLNAVHPGHHTLVFSSSEKPRQLRPFATSAETRPVLAGLLGLYRRGLTGPLPFIPDVSWAAAKSLTDSPAELGMAIAKARDAWVKNSFSSREAPPSPSEDPYYQLVHGEYPAFDEEFLSLAAAVITPLLDRLEDASP
jgi:exodeoxyribonuclease V gamma subunit